VPGACCLDEITHGNLSSTAGGRLADRRIRSCSSASRNSSVVAHHRRVQAEYHNPPGKVDAGRASFEAGSSRLGVVRNPIFDKRLRRELSGSSAFC
jgi:hypothetical protein